MKINDRVKINGRSYKIVPTEILSVKDGVFSGKAILYGKGSRLSDATHIKDVLNITEEEMSDMLGGENTYETI